VLKDFADIKHSAGLSIVSGMLVIPLSPSGSDFLVFFRQGRLKEISWAGNPHEKSVGASFNYLEPRSSFKRWSETVMGTSREWTEHEGLSVNWVHSTRLI
jgi:light-regulated signal transduction histidine kinase (bacteriophytochrome)